MEDCRLYPLQDSIKRTTADYLHFPLGLVSVCKLFGSVEHKWSGYGPELSHSLGFEEWDDGGAYVALVSSTEHGLLP